MTSAPADPFEAALAVTLAIEGGYVDDPADPGGETNLGISRAAYPHLDIRGLTIATVTPIYQSDYWERFACGRLAWPVCGMVFDGCVNAGVEGIKAMQHVLGVTADGVNGPITQAAAAQRDPVELMLRTGVKRLDDYRAMAGFDRYGPAWQYRIPRLVWGLAGVSV